MADFTENHDYPKVEGGEKNWDLTIRDALDALDVDVEIRDIASKRDQYVPYEDALYRATDTGSVYLGDGTNWNQISTGSDTRIDVSDGVTTVSEPSEVTFSGKSAASVDVKDDGDGTSTVVVEATDTRTDVSDGGATVVGGVTDINFGSNISASNDGDGTVTVASTASSEDTRSPFPNHHINYGTSLTNEEIGRFTLPSGVALEVHELDPQLKGGGTNSNVSVDIYDATNATVLASTTAGTATRGSPIATSGTGATILLRISTGSTAVDLCIGGNVIEA